jgi:hypothetical protein
VPLRPLAAMLNLWTKSAPQHGHVVFGPIRSWYMWDPVAMCPACFDAGWGRRAKACPSITAAAVGSNRTDQCCTSGLKGPFPFSGGAATVYSQPLLRALMGDSGRVNADERYVLGARNASELRSPVNGRLYPRAHKRHPANGIFLEDVYIASLMFESFRNRSLALVNMPTYDPPWYSQSWSTIPAAMVYHNLKRDAQWARLRSRWQDVSINSTWRLVCEVKKRAGPSTSEVARFVAKARVPSCCEQWHACTLTTSPRRNLGRSILSEHFVRLLARLRGEASGREGRRRSPTKLSAPGSS